MGDFPIVPPEPVPAPLTYELSSHQRFTTLAVSAVFDGSAAAGDFLPCCSIYAPGGQLIGRTFPSTLTAGSIAEVTYAPFLRAATTAAGAAGTFELLAESNIAGAFPFGSIAAWAPEAALAGAPPLLLSASWTWEWEAAKQGTVAIRNNTATARVVNLAGAWVRDMASGAREILTGGNVAVAAGAFAFVTWTHAAGAVLLDLSVTNRPAPFATAPYAVAVSVQVV